MILARLPSRLLRPLAPLAALLLPQPGLAQAGDAQVSAAPQRAANLPARPALWKLADADTTIWLFGTIHVLPHPVDWFAGPVAKAFDESGELVTEIAIADEDGARAVIQASALRADDRTLRETLQPGERAAYEAALASLGLPANAFDRNDAWFAALMLTLLPLQAQGFNAQSGIEAQVAARAAAARMPNEGLETPEFQIGLFERLPQPLQRRYLAEVVESLPTLSGDIGEMVSAWQHGEADRLADLINDDEQDPEVRKRLITDRNRTWARWLKRRMKAPGVVFVAVGAGHLAGKGSVQDQLARMGLHVTRVQ